jgi:hypothetical protein
MQLLAKNILPEKFWIIEAEDKSKLGTIQVNHRRVRVFINGDSYEYNDFESALKQHHISASNEPIKHNNTVAEYSVNGYPAKDQPHNEVYDAKQGLPMYTKTEKSKCYHAAGYYVIRFDFAWAPAYCPKVITLKRNEYRGPYKTEIEMKEQLRKANAKN